MATIQFTNSRYVFVCDMYCKIWHIIAIYATCNVIYRIYHYLATWRVHARPVTCDMTPSLVIYRIHQYMATTRVHERHVTCDMTPSFEKAWLLTTEDLRGKDFWFQRERLLISENRISDNGGLERQGRVHWVSAHVRECVYTSLPSKSLKVRSLSF